jgi:hypothetical protein
VWVFDIRDKAVVHIDQLSEDNEHGYHECQWDYSKRD